MYINCVWCRCDCPRSEMFLFSGCMSSGSSSAAVSPQRRHQVGVLGATSYMLAAIIGSGIFLSPAAVMRNTQSVSNRSRLFAD